MVFEYHGFYFMYQTRTSQLFIKQLLLQCFFQQIRHRFIISLSISDICKNLGKGFCMIYFYKMTVFRKRFLISKNVLNLFWCIIMILFLMDNTLSANGLAEQEIHRGSLRLLLQPVSPILANLIFL